MARTRKQSTTTASAKPEPTPQWSRDEDGRTLKPMAKHFSHHGHPRIHVDGRNLAADFSNDADGRMTLHAKRKLTDGETLVDVIAQQVSGAGGRGTLSGTASGSVVEG